MMDEKLGKECSNRKEVKRKEVREGDDGDRSRKEVKVS